MNSLTINEKAAALIKKLAEACTEDAGISSFSVTVYDTAWLAMVTKSSDGETRWLFPECFQFLLAHQTEEGGWESYASEVDGILNTMAALLALKMHADAPQYQDCPLPEDIQTRISKCSTALQEMLDHWDVEACIHVGFEILVPSLLQSLRGLGLSFSIPREEALMALKQKKLVNFDPQILYQETCTTLIHSLEAFIHRIDFDRVSQHSVGGSMMGSPASTAAYLMHTSRWDDEAERYLSTVVTSIKGKEHGGVPSAFPTTTFMLSWTISTLLRETFTLEELGWVNTRTIADFLERELGNGNGLVGFAPGFLEDADDTAKTLLSLNALGRPTSPNAMIAAFEGKDHFKTFRIECNPSFSANCNILNALLSVSEPDQYAAQILKATVFLCDLWYNGDAKDKWNLSKQYSRMLLAQALMRLLSLWDSGALGGELEDLIRNRLPVILTQILVRTLCDLDQSQSQSSEASAYAVLTLTYISSLPWLSTLETQISDAIGWGKRIVRDAVIAATQPEYLWVEKVTYSSSILSETYCLAASKAQASSHAWGEAVQSLADIPIKQLTKFTHFFSQLPLFSKGPQWKLQASLIEGYLFYPQLKSISLDIFPRKDMAKDEYLEYIPLTWTACNNNQKTPMNANFLWDMMVISMLNYQADEYMEAVIGGKFANDLISVKRLIHHLCETTSTSSSDSNTSSDSNGDKPNGPKKRPHSDCKGNELEEPAKRNRPEPNSASGNRSAATPQPVTNGSAPTLTEVSQTLSRFIKHILTHQHIAHSSTHDRSTLGHELRSFLLAHITQIEDNCAFASQPPTPSSSSDQPSIFHTPAHRSYFTWIHTTSAVHTSCPYSFAFAACLTGSNSSRSPLGSNKDCFTGAEQKYLAQAMVRHLAAMCRQYNDYGSVARDRAEENVNSVNFAEFHEGEQPGTGGKAGGGIKEALFRIAEYERECLGLTRGRLEKLVPGKVGEMLGLFVDVTDLYGQIYVARDIASRMR